MAYSIYLNGAIINIGIADIQDDIQEELFILKMKQRYQADDTDIVEVVFE